jgi:CheY-like chemotaxis protein
MHLLRSTPPSTIALHTELDDGAPPVMIDPVQVSKCCSTCASMPVTLGGTGHPQLQPGRESFEAVCASCRECVRPLRRAGRMADTGPGIAPEVMDRMFEPFFSTKEVGRGSGMGLAMAHGIVHDHGGHIVIDTCAGRGTVFGHPRARGRSTAGGARRRPRRRRATPRRRLSGRVLVVEDERMVCEYMAELLGGWGLDVTVMSDPVEAHAWLARDPSLVDAVVTDHMPRMTGLQLARKLAGARPELLVILYTGYPMITDEDLRECGACSLPENLGPALFEMLQRHLDAA